MDPFAFYVQHEYWFAAAQLLLAMLGMGATLAPRDFAELWIAPKALGVGLGVQMLIVPLIAALMLAVVNMPIGVAIGLALCAAIPGGTVSNIFTYLARGDIALSIALTAVATLACLLSTPIVLSLLIAQHLPADFVMPAGRIAAEIGVFLLLPLLAGMLYLRFFPGSAERFSRLCIRASLFGVLLIVVGAAGAGRLDLQAFGAVNALYVAAFIGLLVLVAWLLPFLSGLSRSERAAIHIEVVVRNVNLGLLIKASIFPAVAGQADPLGDTVLFTVLLYGGLQLLAGTAQIFAYRRGGAATPEQPPVTGQT